MAESSTTLENEQIVRKAHQIVEDQDLEEGVTVITDDQTLADSSYAFTAPAGSPPGV